MVCSNCEKEMEDGVSCIKVPFRGHDPVPNGDQKCHDCYCPPGGYHHPGCDMERCPACGGQAISCPCPREG